MASFGIYVPDESDLIKKIQERADREHDGKVSSYARAAIERDLLNRDNGDASPTASDDFYVIERLADKWLGPLEAIRLKMHMRMVRSINGKMGCIDQRHEITALLKYLSKALDEQGSSEAGISGILWEPEQHSSQVAHVGFSSKPKVRPESVVATRKKDLREKTA